MSPISNSTMYRHSEASPCYTVLQLSPRLSTSIKGPFCTSTLQMNSIILASHVANPLLQKGVRSGTNDMNLPTVNTKVPEMNVLLKSLKRNFNANH